jgi:hypothetical protein
VRQQAAFEKENLRVDERYLDLVALVNVAETLSDNHYQAAEFLKDAEMLTDDELLERCHRVRAFLFKHLGAELEEVRQRHPYRDLVLAILAAYVAAIVLEFAHGMIHYHYGVNIWSPSELAHLLGAALSIGGA